MGGYIILVGAFILVIFIILFFASKSTAKDKNVSSAAIAKQAVLGKYSEDSLPKEILLLVFGIGMLGVDFFAGFPQFPGSENIGWRLAYSAAIVIGGYQLTCRFLKHRSKPNAIDESVITGAAQLVSGEHEILKTLDN